jgi:hypothetical protein
LFPDLKLIWHLIVPYSQNLSVWCYNGIYNPRSPTTLVFFLFLRCWLKLHFRLVMKIHLQHLVILDQTDWQWQIGITTRYRH